MTIKDTIPGWLRRAPEEDDRQAEIDATPGRKSSDKEDILAVDRFGMSGLDFDDGQKKPRH